MSTVRPSRRPRCGLRRMRLFFYSIKSLPHPEEARSAVSKDALSPRASEPARLVDDVAQLLPGDKAPGIVAQHREPALVEIGAVAGGVRRDQYPRHGPQRMVGGERLLFEDIERR